MTPKKFAEGSASYIARAGTDSSYFDMGPNWQRVKEKYGMSDKDVFRLFNARAIDEEIAKGKAVRFSHNPLENEGSLLYEEWEHVKSVLGKTDADLYYEGGFWYVK